MLAIPEGKPASVAVLSAGKSVLRTWDPSLDGRYGLVLAVNFAGRNFQHDWLAYTDEQVHQAWPSWGKTRLGTLTPGRGLSRWGASNGVFKGICDYTFPCLLFEVRELQTRTGCSVDVYGWDESASAGLSGAPVDPGRWLRESAWSRAYMPAGARRILG